MGCKKKKGGRRNHYIILVVKNARYSPKLGQGDTFFLKISFIPAPPFSIATNLLGFFSDLTALTPIRNGVKPIERERFIIKEINCEQDKIRFLKMGESRGKLFEGVIERSPAPR